MSMNMGKGPQKYGSRSAIHTLSLLGFLPSDISPINHLGRLNEQLEHYWVFPCLVLSPPLQYSNSAALTRIQKNLVSH